MAKNKPINKNQNDKKKWGEISKASTLAKPNSILLFGIWKRGKTRLAASIAEVEGFDNVLHIDIDRGSAVIGKLYPNVDVIAFKRGDIRGFQKFWDELVRLDGFYNGTQYDAVILDTLTVLQDWFAKSLPSADGYAKWAANKDWVLDILNELHDMTPLGISCLHVAETNILKGSEDEAFVRLVPNVQGSAKQSLGAIPDIIGYCDVIDDPEDEDENLFVVTWAPTERTNTGNRFDLPDMMGNPTLKKVYDLINKEGA